MLPPLTFHEYIHLKHLEGLITESELSWSGSLQKIYSTHNIHELNQHFINYINYGGYPEVIFSEKIQNNPGRYIRSDIVDKVLLRDLPGLYGVQDVQELNSLFTAIAYNSGGEISLEELSKNAGIQKTPSNDTLNTSKPPFDQKSSIKFQISPNTFKGQRSLKFTSPILR